VVTAVVVVVEVGRASVVVVAGTVEVVVERRVEVAAVSLMSPHAAARKATTRTRRSLRTRRPL